MRRPSTTFRNLSNHIFNRSINCWNCKARSHRSYSSRRISIVLRLSSDDSWIVLISVGGGRHHFLIRNVGPPLPVDVFLYPWATTCTLLWLWFINIGSLSVSCMCADATSLILSGHQWTSGDTITAIIGSRAACDLIVRCWLLSLAKITLNKN